MNHAGTLIISSATLYGLSFAVSVIHVVGPEAIRDGLVSVMLFDGQRAAHGDDYHLHSVMFTTRTPGA